MTGRSVWWVNQYAVPPSESGGTRHYDMAAELRRHGWDVRVVASDLGLHSRTYNRRRSARDLGAIEESLGGVPFVWLPAGSYEHNDWRRLLSMLVFSAAVLAFLLRTPRKPGTLFVGSSPHLFGAFATWVAARLRRAVFVLEVRDLWPESYTAVTGDSSSPQVRLLRAIAHFLYRRADAVVVLAEANADAIVRAGVAPGRIHFIPNGVDVEAFALETGRPRDYGVFRFVYTGAHGPANGLDVAVRAAAALAATGRSNIELVLVGDGPSKQELIDLADRLRAPNVVFREPVPKSEIPAVLAEHDAALMVLADEELFRSGVSPNKLFDYLAAERPVLTNVPGLVTRIVEEADAGRSCPPGDSVALAEAMRAFAESRSGHRAMGARGRAYVVDRYDRRRLAGDLASVFTSVG